MEEAKVTYICDRCKEAAEDPDFLYQVSFGVAEFRSGRHPFRTKSRDFCISCLPEVLHQPLVENTED